MPNDTVDFLERIGRDSLLRYADSAELLQAVRLADLDPTLHSAILDGDPRRLGALLGARLDVCGIVVAPADESPDEDQEEQKPADRIALSTRGESRDDQHGSDLSAGSAQSRVASTT